MIIGYIGTFLGLIMYWCYNLLNNYGVAIILFTFITKIILLPISILVQKNSIKIVKMQPKLNNIIAENWGNQDRISEEQVSLYKKEKYSPLMGLIPLFLQILLLMGVIDVMYKPLSYLFRLDNNTINQMINLYTNLTGLSPDIGAIQVYISNTISEGNYLSEFLNINNSTVIDSIQNAKLTFLNFNLGIVPSQNLGKYIVIPVIAAMSALLLCYIQNKINVLQSEQGKGNKLLTAILSVGLSLYLGFFVPSGVGMYWIFSNLFAILQLIFLNKIINPKNFINYTELEESKKALERVKKYSLPKKKWYVKDPFKDREKLDCKKFYSTDKKELVFYSEKNGFYKYFKGIIQVLLSKSDIVIHYVTSDPNDNIFDIQSNRLIAYYVGDIKLITFMMKMDADIVVMTMPDLERYQIKRSYVRKDIEYIYLHHAINSVNLTLRTGALDYFDTVFAHSSYCIEEIKQIEKLHGVKEKGIVKYGYSLLDELIEKYNNRTINDNEQKTILIAPSWQKDNIMDSCIEKLLDCLSGRGYRIIIRPHPQYLRYSMGYIEYLQKMYCSEDSNIEIEKDFSSNETIYNADILITDWSSISYEYSFSTLKPTLYINTPMKVMNPAYDQIECKPYDILIRDMIGVSLDINNLESSSDIIANFLNNKEAYSDQLRKIRDEGIFNIGNSAIVGAQYLINRIESIRENNNKKEEWEK